MLLSDIHTPDDAAQAARKLIQLLSEPFTLGEHHITVTPSIGVAVSPEDGNDLDSLLKHADLAMYDAKQQGPQQLPVLPPRDECTLARTAADGATCARR